MCGRGALAVVAVVLAGVAGLLAGCGGDGGSNADSGRISFGGFDRDLGDFRVWTAAADGSDERPLVREVSWMSDWSPDGRQLVFEDMTSLRMIGTDGSNGRVLLDSLGYQGVPKWSPTGEWIAFEGSRTGPADPANIPSDFKRSVWVVRPDGHDLRRVTDQYDVEPVFSPDGSKLAFGHITAPGPPEQAVQSVVAVNVDGSNRREIVPPTPGLQHVDWSPDGKWLTFNIESLPGVADQPPGRGSVYAVRPDGTNLHILVAATREWVFYKAVWSPEGDKLLSGCNTPGGGIDRLCKIDTATGSVNPLIDHSERRLAVNFPAWGSPS